MKFLSKMPFELMNSIQDFIDSHFLVRSYNDNGVCLIVTKYFRGVILENYARGTSLRISRIFLLFLLIFSPSVIEPFASVILASPGLDFTIEPVTSSQTQWNEGESVVIRARIKNTGDITIPAGEADAIFWVITPSGSLLIDGFDTSSQSIGPGKTYVFESSWDSSGRELGWYDVKVEVSVSVEGTVIEKDKTQNDVFQLVEEPPFDFSVSVSPSSQTVEQGGYVEYTVTVTLESGSSQTVSLDLSGLPSDVGVHSFSPSSGEPDFTSTLSIGVLGEAPFGEYTLTVTGTGGGVSKSDTCTLKVNPPPEKWHFGDPSPSSRTVQAGDTVTFSVPVNLESGSPTVTLDDLVDPDGVVSSYSYDPSSGSPDFTTTLTVTISESASPGTYEIYAHGSSSKWSETSPAMTIIVPEPSFYITAPSSLNIIQGESTEVTVTVHSEDKFSGSIDLALVWNVERPSWVTDDGFSPNPVSVLSGGSSSSILTVTVSDSASPGTYITTIVGTSGNLNYEKTVNVIVKSATIVEEEQMMIDSVEITSASGRKGCFVVGAKDTIKILLRDTMGNPVTGEEERSGLKIFSMKGDYVINPQKIRKLPNLLSQILKYEREYLIKIRLVYVEHRIRQNVEDLYRATI